MEEYKFYFYNPRAKTAYFGVNFVHIVLGNIWGMKFPMRRKYLPTLLLPLKLFLWKVLKQCSLSAPNAAKRRKKKRVRQARLRLSFPLRFYLHHHQRQCWHSLKIGFQKNSFWQSFEPNLWKGVSIPKFYFSRTSFFSKTFDTFKFVDFHRLAGRLAISGVI